MALFTKALKNIPISSVISSALISHSISLGIRSPTAPPIVEPSLVTFRLIQIPIEAFISQFRRQLTRAGLGIIMGINNGGGPGTDISSGYPALHNLLHSCPSDLLQTPSFRYPLLVIISISFFFSCIPTPAFFSRADITVIPCTLCLAMAVV